MGELDGRNILFQPVDAILRNLKVLHGRGKGGKRRRRNGVEKTA